MKQKIKEYFEKEGFGKISVKHTKLGTSGNTYIVRADERKFLFKLFEKGGKKDVRKILMFLKKINKKEELCINPINDKIIRIGNQVGFYYEFFEGIPFEEIKMKNKFKVFANLIGKFNKRSIAVGGIRSDSHFIKEQIGKARKSLIEIKEKEFSTHMKLIEEGLSKIPTKITREKYRKTLVHLDLHMDNVLYDSKKNKSLIIDVEDLDYAILAREITVIMSYKLQDSMSENKKMIRKVMKVYEKNVKLQKREKKLIPYLFILRKIGELRYGINQYKTGVMNKKRFGRGAGNSKKQFKIILKNFDEFKAVFNWL